MKRFILAAALAAAVLSPAAAAAPGLVLGRAGGDDLVPGEVACAAWSG